MTAYENITALLERVAEVTEDGTLYELQKEDVQQLKKLQQQVKNLNLFDVSGSYYYLNKGDYIKKGDVDKQDYANDLAKGIVKLFAIPVVIKCPKCGELDANVGGDPKHMYCFSCGELEWGTL